MYPLQYIVRAIRRRIRRKFSQNFHLDVDMFQSIKGIADDQKQTPEEFVKERIDRALQERTVGDDYYKRWLSLTKREKKVVELICLNYNNKEIAAELQIAEPTVKSHITRILGKVGLSNRHELRLVMSSFDFWDLDS